MKQLRLTQLKRQQLPPSSTNVTITAERPLQLKDLEITVECKSETEFELGMQDGRPVAFFVLKELGGFSKISVGVSPGEPMFTVSEFSRASETRFTLNRGDFVLIDYQAEKLLTNSEPIPVALAVYIWLDGGWRMYQTVLDRDLCEEPCACTRPDHSFLTLDLFYEKRRGILKRFCVSRRISLFAQHRDW